MLLNIVLMSFNYVLLSKALIPQNEDLQKIIICIFTQFTYSLIRLIVIFC